MTLAIRIHIQPRSQKQADQKDSRRVSGSAVLASWWLVGWADGWMVDTRLWWDRFDPDSSGCDCGGGRGGGGVRSRSWVHLQRVTGGMGAGDRRLTTNETPISTICLHDFNLAW